MWYEMPKNWPDDAAVVWCRKNYWFSTPFLATFTLATFTFETSDGAIIPWYEVSRWRVQ